MLVVIYSSFVVVLSLIFLVYRLFPRLSLQDLLTQSPPKIIDDIAECNSILKCISIGDKIGPNIIPAVKSRALPNQRLVRAFGIDNAFTTMNDDYRQKFRKRAAEKISHDSVDWKDVAQKTREIVREMVLPCDKIKGRIPLDWLIQSLSLRMSLYVLFDTDPFSLDPRTVSILTNNINNLWIESKKTQPSQDVIDLLNGELQEILVQILPSQPQLTQNLPAGEEKPMNFILPAYETLWRVVLRCFLEVTFHPESVPEWRQTLVSLLEDPVSNFATSEPVTVKYIVQEALRLYPPTRRVYRTFQTDPRSIVDVILTKIYPQYKMFTVAADIEGCHRKADFWGERSLKFDPSRWHNFDKRAAHKAFMPFGGGNFVCPAQKDFGPMIIGVLVAALVEYINEGEWQPSDQQRLEWPLDLGRKAYRNFYLHRINPAETVAVAHMCVISAEKRLNNMGLKQV